MPDKKEKHEHDYKPAGYDGAGRQILKCSCGAEIRGV